MAGEGQRGHRATADPAGPARRGGASGGHRGRRLRRGGRERSCPLQAPATTSGTTRSCPGCPAPRTRSAGRANSDELAAERLADRALSAEIGAAPAVETAERTTGSTAGAPLPGPVRRSFESGFGQRLDGVRLHSGSSAAGAAAALQARAFTVGSDIVFGAGELAPETPSGQRLLAHELAHVVQAGDRPHRWRAAGLPLARRRAHGLRPGRRRGRLRRPQRRAVLLRHRDGQGDLHRPPGGRLLQHGPRGRPHQGPLPEHPAGVRPLPGHLRHPQPVPGSDRDPDRGVQDPPGDRGRGPQPRRGRQLPGAQGVGAPATRPTP